MGVRSASFQDSEGSQNRNISDDTRINGIAAEKGALLQDHRRVDLKTKAVCAQAHSEDHDASMQFAAIPVLSKYACKL